jgi:hypothetical protein
MKLWRDTGEALSEAMKARAHEDRMGFDRMYRWLHHPLLRHYAEAVA